MKNINVYLLANAINAVKQVNENYRQPHEELLNELLELLPSGSGIDSGIKLNEEETTKDKIVFTFGFHHMNENGYYDGWTDHKLIITPSLAYGFEFKIAGRNRNRIKEYLNNLFYDVFYYDNADNYFTVIKDRQFASLLTDTYKG